MYNGRVTLRGIALRSVCPEIEQVNGCQSHNYQGIVMITRCCCTSHLCNGISYIDRTTSTVGNGMMMVQYRPFLLMIVAASILLTYQ